MQALYDWLAALAEGGVLPDAFRYPFVTRGLIAMLLLAPLLGGLSHLVVARRMAFFSTAIGQAALTGIAIGLLLGEPIESPYGGMFGFCYLCALCMVFVKRRARLPPDALIGVFLALTLGLGVTLLVGVTKRYSIHQVEGVLFGSLLTVTESDLALLAVALLGAAGVLGYHYNAILLDTLHPGLARSAGIRTAFVDYVFVMVLTTAIVVSLKIIGTLLVEAMVVVPAAAARPLARSVRSYALVSVVVALVAGVGGIFASTIWSIPTGGAVTLALTAMFFVCLSLGSLWSRRSA